MLEPQKKKVSIDITKHTRTSINGQGNEISREEALGGLKPKINIGQPQVSGGETEDKGGAGGEEEKKEAK